MLNMLVFGMSPQAAVDTNCRIPFTRRVNLEEDMYVDSVENKHGLKHDPFKALDQKSGTSADRAIG